MSSAEVQSTDSSIGLEFSAENISDELGIRRQPASALAELSGWDELKAGIENDRDWEEIDGVGPATAETLSDWDANVPVSSPTPDVETSVDPASHGSDASTEREGGDSSGQEEDNEEGSGSEETEDGSTDSGEQSESDEDTLYEVSSPPAAFEASIEKSRIAAFFDAVSRHVDEAKIRIWDEGLELRAVDPANVQMVEGSISSLAFESYRSEMGVIGMNLDRFTTILGNANKGDLVHLQLDPAKRKLTISIRNIEYTMALIDPDSIRQEPDLPDLELDTKVIMEGSVFSDAVKAIDMVAEHAHFSYGEEGTEISGEGDTDDANLDLTNNDGVHDIDATGAGKSIFSLDYLKNFEKMVNKDTVITARVGNEFPIMVDFGLKDGLIQIEGMLAPRIQSD